MGTCIRHLPEHAILVIVFGIVKTRHAKQDIRGGDEQECQWLNVMSSLTRTVHDTGGHLGSHRLHLRPLGVQVSSFKTDQYQPLSVFTLSGQTITCRSARLPRSLAKLACQRMS